MAVFATILVILVLVGLGFILGYTYASNIYEPEMRKDVIMMQRELETQYKLGYERGKQDAYGYVYSVK